MDDLSKVAGGLFVDGQTHLFDALCLAAGDFLAQRLTNGQSQRLYGLIILTDGGDSGTGSVTTEGEMFACLDAAGEQVEITILALAYSPETDTDFLGQLVERGEGRLLNVTPENIFEQLSTLTFDS